MRLQSVLRCKRSFSTAVHLNYQEALPRDSSFHRQPLVILHGLLGSANNWRNVTQKPEVQEGRRIISVDLRNHGASPHTDVFDLPSLSLDVVALLDRLDIEHCTLLGHSLGGKISMLTALSNPDRVSKLVVVDIAPAEYEKDNKSWKAVGDIVRSMHSVPVADIEDRQHAERMLQPYIPDKMTRSFVLQNLVAAKGSNGKKGDWHWRVNLNAILAGLPSIAKFPYQDVLRERGPFSKPTLFIRGGRSEYLTEQHRPVLATLFPRALVATVPDAGHWVHYESPDRFLQELVPFLNDAH